jgi:hypothetical protein
MFPRCGYNRPDIGRWHRSRSMSNPVVPRPASPIGVQESNAHPHSATEAGSGLTGSCGWSMFATGTAMA